MAGAFHMEAPNGAAPLGGMHGGILQPPAPPSISNSLFLGRSMGSMYSEISSPALNVKRKRQDPRSSAAHMDEYTNRNTFHLDPGSRPISTRKISQGRSARYTIAGSLETPNGADQRQLGDMEDSTYSDVDYRRALGSRRPLGQTDSPGPVHSTAQPAAGWSRYALEAIGGVVGKVWEFCKEGAFRGFYAGGGRGYDITSQPAQVSAWCNEHDIPTLPEIPGGFPESDYRAFHEERETPESTPPPAAKRRQIVNTATTDELRKNWVMVNDPADKEFHRYASPHSQCSQQSILSMNRPISAPTSRPKKSGSTYTPSSRVSHAGASSLTNRQPASFASPRPSILPARPATPSRLPVPSRPRSSSTVSSKVLQQPAHAAGSSSFTPPRGHRRTQSSASAASAASATPARLRKRESSAKEIVQDNSPRLDRKARQMVVKRMKQEEENDARMNDLNSRLMDMIRQGKEALGTTIEIDGYDDFDMGGNDPWEDD